MQIGNDVYHNLTDLGLQQYEQAHANKISAEQSLRAAREQKKTFDEITRWVTIGGAAGLTVLFVMLQNKKAGRK